MTPEVCELMPIFAASALSIPRIVGVSSVEVGWPEV
jgi:hypothetical protein